MLALRPEIRDLDGTNDDDPIMVAMRGQYADVALFLLEHDTMDGARKSQCAGMYLQRAVDMALPNLVHYLTDKTPALGRVADWSKLLDKALEVSVQSLLVILQAARVQQIDILINVWDAYVCKTTGTLLRPTRSMHDYDLAPLGVLGVWEEWCLQPQVQAAFGCRTHKIWNELYHYTNLHFWPAVMQIPKLAIPDGKETLGRDEISICTHAIFIGF
jgi:hypothetical protein